VRKKNRFIGGLLPLLSEALEKRAKYVERDLPFLEMPINSGKLSFVVLEGDPP